VFFTFLPGTYIVEPLVAILTIVYAVRATRGPASGTRLLVCWIALAVHSLVIIWLLTRPGMRG
jgi:hypothetical protein